MSESQDRMTTRSSKAPRTSTALTGGDHDSADSDHQNDYDPVIDEGYMSQVDSDSEREKPRGGKNLARQKRKRQSRSGTVSKDPSRKSRSPRSSSPDAFTCDTFDEDSVGLSRGRRGAALGTSRSNSSRPKETNAKRQSQSRQRKPKPTKSIEPRPTESSAELGDEFLSYLTSASQYPKKMLSLLSERKWFIDNAQTLYGAARSVRDLMVKSDAKTREIQEESADVLHNITCNLTGRPTTKDGQTEQMIRQLVATIDQNSADHAMLSSLIDNLRTLILPQATAQQDLINTRQELASETAEKNRLAEEVTTLRSEKKVLKDKLRPFKQESAYRRYVSERKAADPASKSWFSRFLGCNSGTDVSD